MVTIKWKLVLESRCVSIAFILRKFTGFTKADIRFSTYRGAKLTLEHRQVLSRLALFAQ